MHKIKLNSLKNIIKICSSKEIDFVLYLSRCQNEFGHARNLDYRNICAALSMSKKHFYSMLRKLENKSIITVDWTNTLSWNITINNNMFLSEKDYSNYLNTNKDFLYRRGFQRLNVNAKKLILQILCFTSKLGKPFKIGLNKLKKWTGINSNLLLSHIEDIKAFFSIDFSGGIFTFIAKVNSLKSENTEHENQMSHRIKSFFNNYKITHTDKDVKDIVVMFKQYKDKSKRLISTMIDTIFRYDKIVQPKLINARLQ